MKFPMAISNGPKRFSNSSWSSIFAGVALKCITKTKLRTQSKQWSAAFRWSLGPNPAWCSKETTTIGKTHPTLAYVGYKCPTLREKLTMPRWPKVPWKSWLPWILSRNKDKIWNILVDLKLVPDIKQKCSYIAKGASCELIIEKHLSDSTDINQIFCFSCYLYTTSYI